MSRTRSVLWFVVLSWLVLFNQVTLGGSNNNTIDYKGALIKSLLYFEAQRSGALPPDQRVLWRANSALTDGQYLGIDLAGGYYDAGDNLKLGFPLAFTVTMLSWSIIEFEQELKANNELANALTALRWGIDYLIKANPDSKVLYAGVGNPDSDHQCWQRPEDMTTPRTVFRIDVHHPGSDLAAETAAAFAAASIALSNTDPDFAASLLPHAKGLYDFAKNYEGIYSNSIPEVAKIYASSGYEDELTWAAIWLYTATDGMEDEYLDDITDDGGPRSSFSWDDKFVGAQVLVSKNIFEGMIGGGGPGPDLGSFQTQAEHFVCSCIQKGNNPFRKTPGGLLWFMPWNNMQYVASATFVATVYSKYLTAHNRVLHCSDGPVSPSEIISSIQSQMDYILGSNPLIKSYMVGFGPNFPTQVHHRGASIISINKDPTPVTCQGGFDAWFDRNEPNPNVLDGAIVSPDENDAFLDVRSNYQFTEPTTASAAPLVGVLAYFASL